MLSYSRSHLANHLLVRTLAAVVTQDRTTTAEMLALIAEVDRRGLHRAAGYEALASYLVEKLGMSEDMVYKRIGAARVARRYPATFALVAEGRLHLTAILMVRPHLTPENAPGLLAEACGKTRDQVELMLASRFPKADVPTSLTLVATTIPSASPPLAQADMLSCSQPSDLPAQIAANTQSSLAPERVAPEKSVPEAAPMVPPVVQRRVAPLSTGRFELRLTISQELHDKLKHAQDLLGHSIPSGDFAQILERALDELIAKLEKSKFAATGKPRVARRSSKNPRHIPAEMKRAVRLRDEGRCTYVSDDGHRCDSRTRLEYDHERPLAKGGRTCVANLRLRCRAHNQLEAERAFGAGFMDEKRGRAHMGTQAP